MLASWLHVAALAVYVGGLISLWIILLPASSKLQHPQGQARLLVDKLKLYNPLQTGALGVLVLSGAIQLTDLKAAYRESFAKELGMILLVMFGIHQTMGVGHPFVRRCESGEPISTQDIGKVVRRLKYSIPPLLLLTFLTAYM